MSTKPITVLASFFKMFVDSTTTMLDPTAGSGSSLRAGEEAGASFVAGLELNPEFASRANLTLNKARLTRKEQDHEEA